MKTIDERVVEMRFDNKRFEEGAKETMSTLQKLKNALTFKNAEKGFKDVENASKNVSFSDLEKKTSRMYDNFSALGLIGVTAIQNITNSVINLGKQMSSAVLIEPINAGFSKYERMIQSTQTIINATGKSMAEVEGYLDDLAKYTDETSYDFADMTDNIGKFTSAGIELGDAVEAMKGIANEAAKSGVGIQGASRAMYNFSQALSQGSVKVQDWMSIENANMATKEFKEQIIQTAKELGTLNAEGKTAKGTLVDFQSFRSTLSEGWFTSDVLIKTLKKYADTTTDFGLAAFRAAQEAKTFTDALNAVKDAASTGWMNTYKLIFGNYEEAKVFFTDLANVFSMIVSDSAAARNQVVSDWREAGGRENLLTGLYNTLGAIRKILTPIQVAFHEIIPPITGERLAKLSEGFRNFSRRIQISGDTAQKLYRIFRGLFSVLDIGRQTLLTIGRGFKSVLSALLPGVDGVLSLGASIGDTLYLTRQWIVQNETLATVLNTIGKVIGSVVGSIAKFGGAVGKRFGQFLSNIAAMFANTGQFKFAKDAVDDFGNSVQKVFQSMPNFLEQSVTVLSAFISKLRNLDRLSFKGIGKVFTELHEEFADFFSFGDQKIQELRGVFSTFVNSLSEGIDRIGGRLESLKNKIVSFATVINYKLKSISAADILVTAGAAGIIASVGKIADAISALTAPLEGVGSVLLGFGKNLKTLRTALRGFAFREFGEGFAAFGKGVLEVAAAIGVLTFLDQKKVVSSAKALGILVGAMEVIAVLATSVGKINRVSISMIGIVAAIGLMVKVLEKVHELDPFATDENGEYLNLKGWEQAAGVVAGIMVAIGAFAAALGKYAPTLSISVGTVVAFSIAMYALIGALKKLSDLNIEGVRGGKAMRDVYAMMVGLALVAGLIKRLKVGLGETAGLLLLSIAMRQMIAALESITNLEISSALGTIGKLALIMGAIIALIIAVRKSTQNIASIGIGMIGLTIGLNLMVSAIQKIADVPTGVFAKGLIGIGLMSLVMRALISSTKNAGKYSARAGVFLIAAAGALTLMAISMKTIAGMEWEQIAKGMLALGSVTAMFASIMYTSKFVTSDLKSLGKIAGAIAAIATILALLTLLDSRKLAIASVSLIGVTGMFAVLLKAADGAEDISAGTIAKMLVIVGGIAAILAGLGLVPTEGLLEKATSISEVLLALSASMRILSTPALAMVSWGALAKMGAMLLGVVAIFGALGALFQVVEAFDVGWFDTAGEIFGKIGNGIGKFVGGIVGGIGEGITNALPSIGDNIAEFVNKVVPVLEEIKDVDQAKLDAFLTFIQSITLLGLGDTANSVLFGKNTDYETLSENLSHLVDAMVDFSATSGEIQIENLENAKLAAQAINEISTYLPKSGGLVQAFTGEVDYAKFSEGLVMFGNGIVEFSQTVRELDASAIQNTIGPAKSLFELAGLVPPSSGLITWFTGKNSTDLQRFGNGITDFATYLMQYSDKVSGFSYASVLPSIRALQAFVSAASDLPDQTVGGTLGVFGSQLNVFGDYLVTFAQKLEEVSEKQITDAIKKIGRVDEIVPALQKFKEVFETVTDSLALDFIGQIQAYTDDLISVGGFLIEGLMSGLKKKRPELMKLAREIGADVDKEIRKALEVNSPSKKAIKTALFVGEGLIIGLKKNRRAVKKAGYALGDALQEGVREGVNVHSPPPENIDEGEQVDNGLIIGINNGIAKVKAAGENVGVGLQEGIVTGLKKVNSNVASYVNFNYESFDDTFADFEDFVTAWYGNTGEEAGDEFAGEAANAMGSGKSQAQISAAARNTARIAIRSFTDEISRLDLHQTTAGLEKQLWEALNPNATDMEKSAMEMELTAKKLEFQAQVVSVAKDEYQDALTKYGATAKETQEVYNKYLQEQIELAQLTNELTEYQKTQSANAASAQVAYAKWMAESSEDLLKMGYALEDIEAAARKETGYNPSFLTKTMTSDATKATTTALSSVQTVFADNAEKTFGSLMTSFGNYGFEYGSLVGNSFISALGDSKSRIDSSLDELEVSLSKRIENIRAKIAAILSDDQGETITITPVLDLSQIEGRTSQLNRMLGGSSLSVPLSLLSGVLNGQLKSPEAIQVTNNTTNNYAFNQTNISPEPLSRQEIYRQTSNQFSAFKQRTDSV